MSVNDLFKLKPENFRPFLTYSSLSRNSPDILQQYTDIFTSVSYPSKCQLKPVDVQIASSSEDIKQKANQLLATSRSDVVFKGSLSRRNNKIQAKHKKSESQRVLTAIKTPQSSDISYKLGDQFFKFQPRDKNQVLQKCDDFLSSLGWKQQKPTFYLPITIEKLEQMKEQLSPSCFNAYTSKNESKQLLTCFQQFSLSKQNSEQIINQGSLGPPSHRKEAQILRD